MFGKSLFADDFMVTQTGIDGASMEYEYVSCLEGSGCSRTEGGTPNHLCHLYLALGKELLYASYRPS